MSMMAIRNLYGGTPVRSDSSGAVTDQILVAAIGNQKIIVDYLAVSMDTAGSFVLTSKGAGAGSNIGIKVYLGANGGAALDTPYVKTNQGEALAFTTTGTGNWSVYVVYHTIG